MLYAPVPCGAQGRKQESPEGHLFEEGRRGYAETEEHPGCSRCFEELINRSVLRARQQHAVDHGDEETEDCCAHQLPETLDGETAVPLNAFEKRLAPNEWEDDQTTAKRNQIQGCLADERVMIVGLGV